MLFRLDPKIDDIIQKGLAGDPLADEELVTCLTLPLCGRETYALMEAANRMSRIAFKNKGERHMHIGVNVAPCPFNCSFCSLTIKAGIFKESVDFSVEQLIHWAREGQDAGADAVNLMTTGTYSFETLLDVCRAMKREVSIPLVANTRDINHEEGEALLEAGFQGFYHAIRLGEGRDTPFKVEKRLNTIRVLRDVGLLWMNCIEPVGPEHDPRELAHLMNLAREYGAVYSGVMRRVNFPGSPMEHLGMINELEMARMVAVSRLAMGYGCRAHCTHEPHTASLAAGANLFFPEVGSSPRDVCGDTEKGRGKDVAACGMIYREMGWDPTLPSNVFTGGSSEIETGAPPSCPSTLSGPAPQGSGSSFR